jgi:hypothetical protein
VRWAALLLVVVVAGVIAGGVFAYVRSHDAVPGDVRACATANGAYVVRGEEGLGFARQDIRDGTLRVARRYRLHDDHAVLLQGSGYRILVVGTPAEPPLTGRDLPFRVYRSTPTFAGVLTEHDPLRTLDACARKSAG